MMNGETGQVRMPVHAQYNEMVCFHCFLLNTTYNTGWLIKKRLQLCNDVVLLNNRILTK